LLPEENGERKRGQATFPMCAGAADRNLAKFFYPSSPKLPLRALLSLPLRKADALIIQGISRKITSFPPHESKSQGNFSLLPQISFSSKSQTCDALSPRGRPIDTFP